MKLSLFPGKCVSATPEIAIEYCSSSFARSCSAPGKSRVRIFLTLISYHSFQGGSIFGVFGHHRQDVRGYAGVGIVTGKIYPRLGWCFLLPNKSPCWIKFRGQDASLRPTLLNLSRLGLGTATRRYRAGVFALSTSSAIFGLGYMYKSFLPQNLG